MLVPCSFLTLFVVRGIRRDWNETIEQLFGRLLPRRADMPIALGFVLAAVALRLLLGRCFGLSPEPRNAGVMLDLLVLAPIDEELIFRGMFLGILLARFPRHPGAAVIWSAAIFLGLHGYAGDDVPAVAGVFSLGLLCGSAYVATRCVPVCIACHALYNTLTWWADTPRIMTLSSVLWGLGGFLLGATAIAWALHFFIKRKRCGSGAVNGIQSIESSPNETPSPAELGG